MAKDFPIRKKERLILEERVSHPGQSPAFLLYSMCPMGLISIHNFHASKHPF